MEKTNSVAIIERASMAVNPEALEFDFIPGDRWVGLVQKTGSQGSVRCTSLGT